MLTEWLMTPAGLALDRWLVRWTGQSLLSRVFARQAGFSPRPILLLVTCGRRSGKRRMAVLPYFDIEGLRIVVGSRGGLPEDPGWVHNLRANPQIEIRTGRRWHPVRARELHGAERDRVWRELLEQVPTYATYQERCAQHRLLPVIALE